jgi:hypothetical protein
MENGFGCSKVMRSSLASTPMRVRTVCRSLAEKLMHAIFQAAADFCQDASFTNDVTILVVKCDFERPYPAKECRK